MKDTPIILTEHPAKIWGVAYDDPSSIWGKRVGSLELCQTTELRRFWYVLYKNQAHQHLLLSLLKNQICLVLIFSFHFYARTCTKASSFFHQKLLKKCLLIKNLSLVSGDFRCPSLWKFLIVVYVKVMHSVMLLWEKRLLWIRIVFRSDMMLMGVLVLVSREGRMSVIPLVYWARWYVQYN